MDTRQESIVKNRALPMARSMCWHCQSEVTGEYLCGQCVKVQPLSKELDFFACFQLPRCLEVDEERLERTFYQLSRTFHPDFYSAKDDAEQTISLGNSAFLNTAYRTLKDPIKRAEYLIRLEAGAVKDIRSNPPADLFEEILEIQADVESFRELTEHGAPSERDALRDALRQSRDRLAERQIDMDRSLHAKFHEWDQLQSQGRDSPHYSECKSQLLRDMREILSNRTYIRNIIADLAGTIAS